MAGGILEIEVTRKTLELGMAGGILELGMTENSGDWSNRGNPGAGSDSLIPLVRGM